MKTIINDDITEDELNELNRVLTDKNIDFDDGDDKRIDNKFNRSVDYFFKNRKMFSKMSIVDIFKWFYYLGVNTEPDYKDISIEEVMKIIDDKNFIETVSDCIKNPKDNEKYSIDIDDKDNLVYLTHKEHKLAHKLLYYIHKFDNYKLPLMYSYMMLYNYDKPYIITGSDDFVLRIVLLHYSYRQ